MADEIIYDDEYSVAAENDFDTPVGEDFDPDAEYNQAPPPLPDGWHFATLRNLGRKDANGVVRPHEGPRPWGPNIKTYYTRVEAAVIDPSGPQNNKRATGNVTTHPEKTSDGNARGSLANMYYKALAGEGLPGVISGKEANQGAHMNLVTKELQSEPQVWVRTQLQGSDRDATESYKERVKNGTLVAGEKKPPTFKGQREFMQEGKLTGVKVLPDGTRIVGQPVIVDVRPKSFTPPAAKK